jgi:uncharacterized protein YndB with AHSA1/START domain
VTEILVDVDLGHPPERVWRALTDRRTLSEWFMRTDLEPREGSRFQLIPEGLLGLTDPLEGELVEVSAPRRLAMLWRGEQLHARVVWELEPTLDGCRLRMRHTGFLGVKGSLRRRELADTYEHLVRDRLPASLHKLAVGRGALVPAAAPLAPRAPLAPPSLADEPTDDHHRPPPRAGVLARLARIPHRRRGQLLAIAGAAILAVVTAAIISSLGVRPFTPPLGAPDDYPYDVPASAGPVPVPTPAGQPPGGGGPQQPGGGPNTGGIPGAPDQPPVGGAPAPPGAPGAPGGGPGGADAPNPPPPGPPGAPPPPPAPPGPAAAPSIRASYTTTKTVPPGYHSEITVENKGTAEGGWTVTVTIQSGARVEGVNGADYTVDGTRVTFTPDHGDQIAPGGSVVIKFHVKSKGAARPVDCEVNDQECAGL